MCESLDALSKARKRQSPLTGNVAIRVRRVTLPACRHLCRSAAAVRLDQVNPLQAASGSLGMAR